MLLEVQAQADNLHMHTSITSVDLALCYPRFP
jgi:hypothetical protein